MTESAQIILSGTEQLQLIGEIAWGFLLGNLTLEPIAGMSHIKVCSTSPSGMMHCKIMQRSDVCGTLVDQGEYEWEQWKAHPKMEF